MSTVEPHSTDSHPARESRQRPQPLLLHLVRRRPAARRLQAVRIRQGHPAVHRAAPPRLRAGADQGRRARRAGEARRRPRLNPEPFLLRKSGQLFYNTSPLDMKKLMGDQDHIGENLRAYMQAFSPAVRDIFERFEFHTQIDRLAKAEPALPRHREVRQHRPAPRGRQQRPDGRGLRGADPQVRRTLQRDRRRALHAARSHPADGQPALHRGRRRPHQARRRALDLRSRPPAPAACCRVAGEHLAEHEPRRPARHVRPGAQPRVLRHLQGRHAHQGPGHRQHHLRQHAVRRRPAGQALRLHALQSAVRRGVEEDREGGPQGSTSSRASTAASVPACRASATARCCSCCT